MTVDLVFAPESDRAVSLVIGGCTTVDCAKQIMTDARFKMQPNPDRQRASAENSETALSHWLPAVGQHSGVTEGQECGCANREGHFVNWASESG